MATIVCDSKRFVFVHIPKCAGQTISKQLREQIDFDVRFVEDNIFTHPVLGRIEPAHIPLPILQEHYPETFDKYRSYDTFAVIREPKARFVSAVAQHLRTARRLDMQALSNVELEKVLSEIMDTMRAASLLPSVDFVHFIRQSDYIFCNGKMIVENIYPMNQLDMLSASFLERYGLVIDETARKNVSKGYRSQALKSVLRAGGSVARAVMPYDVFKRIRRTLRGYALSPDAAAPSAFYATPIKDFVHEFYAPDFELWDARGALHAGAES